MKSEFGGREWRKRKDKQMRSLPCPRGGGTKLHCNLWVLRCSTGKIRGWEPYCMVFVLPSPPCGKQSKAKHQKQEGPDSKSPKLPEMEKVTPSTVHLTRTLSQWLKSFIPTSYHQSLIIHKCKIKARIKWHP